MRLTTVLRRLLGVTRMYVEGGTPWAERLVDGVGAAVVAAVPVRRVRAAGTAVRPAAGAVVAACAVGSAVGVGSVCAVAGVVPTLRGSGGGGVVGGAGQHVHGAVRGDGGVSGAGDGSDDGESAAGDVVAGGRSDCRTGGGAAPGRGPVHEAASDRGRRVQLPEATPLPDAGGGPRPAAGGMGGEGAQRGDAAEVLRPAGGGGSRSDRAGDGGLGGELPEGGAGAGAAGAGGLRPVSRRAAGGRRGGRGAASGATPAG